MEQNPPVDIRSARSRSTPAEAAPTAVKRTAAARVLALLDAFAQHGAPLTLTEIARRADLSLTTAHRLVREVSEWGGLEVDGEGRYRLSRKILELASASTEDLRIRELALPHLVDLQRRTGLTVNLAVRDGDHVMFLEALRAHPNYSGQNRIGGRLPLHASANGQLLLAFADQSVQDDYLSRPLQRYTTQTPVDPDAIRAALAQARREGCLTVSGSVALEAESMAAPVPDALGLVDVSVGVIYVRTEHDPHALKDLLRATARRISRARVERPVLDPRTIAFNRGQAGLV